MRRSKWIWLVWLVVFLSYLVPFTMLRNVTAWHGSFLFWSLTGIVVIAINVYITGAFHLYDSGNVVDGDKRDADTAQGDVANSETTRGHHD